MKQLTVVAQTLLVAGVIVLGSSHAFAKSREAVEAQPVAYGWAEIQALRALVRMP